MFPAPLGALRLRPVQHISTKLRRRNYTVRRLFAYFRDVQPRTHMFHLCSSTLAFSLIHLASGTTTVSRTCVAVGMKLLVSSDIIAIASVLGGVQAKTSQAFAWAIGFSSQKAMSLSAFSRFGAPFTSAMRSPTKNDAS